nr:hypothetical protein [Tanacetum cinerariifolium]
HTRNSYFPNNSFVTILRRRNKRRTRNIVELELRTIFEVAPTADNRTMEELLQAPTEGVARLLQDKLKAGELTKDKIQAEEVPCFEDHEPPHTFRAKAGNLVDVYIAKRNNKWGQMFGFCRFIMVSNSKTVIDSLSNVWIGKLRLHANVARFDRKVAVKPSHAHVNVVSHVVNNNYNVSQATKANSYVNVAKASFNSGEKPSSKDQVDERLIWLEIEGVHIRAWNNEIFSYICTRWGDALFMNGSDRELSSWTPTYVGNDCESDDEGTMGNFDQHQDKAFVENNDESVAGFYMLDRLEETIKVGLALGLNMEGCESTLASLVAEKGEFNVNK